MTDPILPAGTDGKFAATVTVGEKGQIVIPKGARELYGIRPGDTLLLLADKTRGLVLVRPELFDNFVRQALDSTLQPTPEHDSQPNKEQ